MRAVSALLSCLFLSNTTVADTDVIQYSVCLLKDAEYPVSEYAQEITLTPALETFERKAGIRLVIERVATLDYLNPMQIEIRPETLDKFCGPGFALGIVLSSRVVRAMKLRMGDYDAADSWQSHQRTKKTGYAFSLARIAAVFDVERWSRAVNAGGRPVSQMHLEHELGHLFDAEHSSDPTSLMYENLDLKFEDRCDEWTPEVREVIIANREMFLEF